MVEAIQIRRRAISHSMPSPILDCQLHAWLDAGNNGDDDDDDDGDDDDDLQRDQAENARPAELDHAAAAAKASVEAPGFLLHALEDPLVMF